MEDEDTTADAPSASPEPRGSDKIDLSLDEIIKLNRKEQRVNRAANQAANQASSKAANQASSKAANQAANQASSSAANKASSAANKARNRRALNKNTVLKKLDKTGQQQRFNLRQGQYQIQQGPYRSRYMGPAFHGFYKVKPYNIKKAAFGTKGTAVQFGQRKPLFRGVFYQANRGLTAALRRPAPQPRGQKNPPFQPKQKQRGGRPFTLNRVFPAMKSNEKLDKYQKVRSWRRAPSCGSTLTVSLPNSTASPEPVMMEQSTAACAGTSQPKGIPLRFNLKATINQTGVTLNDRFTGMRIRPDPQGPHPGRGSQGPHPGRGPQGPHPGRGPQGPHPGRGSQGPHPRRGPQGGASRGRGRARGRGRTVILQ